MPIGDLPMFAYWNDSPETTLLGLSASASMTVTALDENPPSESTEAENFLIIAPPPDTKRINYTVAWTATRDRLGSFSTSGANFQAQKHTNLSQTGSLNYVEPAYGATTEGVGALEVTDPFVGTDWPVNSTSIVSITPTSSGQIGSRIWIKGVANAFSAGNMALIEIAITVTVTEIELDDGSIYTPVEPVATLDASLVTFLRVQAAKQAEFGEAVAPTFALPVVFEYADAQMEQVAAWDSGAWTPTTIVEQTADYATFTLRGAMFFEMLPFFFNAGFDEVAPSGVGPYTYSGNVLPGVVGDPAAYTFRFGGNDANRPPGSMVQVQDAYLQTLTLSFNLNDKAVTFESVWFGRFVDDNDGAGYTPLAVALPPELGMVNGLLSTLGIQDAGAVGDAFDALAAFECSLMEWQLVLNTGLQPAWAADGNTLTYCGVRHEWPSATFAAHLRTTGDNYAVTKVKSNLRMFQELRLEFSGAEQRLIRLDFTGRWLPNFAAHDRSREEVVLKPTFQAETPAAQMTAPHWLSYDIVTHWGGA